MPSIFSKFRRDKDGSGASISSKKGGQQTGYGEPLPPKPTWTDAWARKFVEPEEIQELLRGCTQEMKSRALDLPFMILPFRPNADSTATKSFIRNFFGPDSTRGIYLRGESLSHELRLTEPDVLCNVVKWCWSRLQGGVVTWEAYELFRIGEQDSEMARDSFETFMPISVESEARRLIIDDFFDLLASIAARGKRNGLGGRKLSRLAGWWAFEHKDTGNGFDGGYKSWASAADAASHLFFAYLRSKAPTSGGGVNGISTLPISLQSLVQATEYPPETPTLLQSTTSKIGMIVDSVSPTPFALLRRAKHFEYRDDDPSLQAFASYRDPVHALTDECRRVLECLSSVNQSASHLTKPLKNQPDESWSRFEDLGFAGMGEEQDQEEDKRNGKPRPGRDGLTSTPQSRTQDMGRPTTPSWAEFLSSGFADEPGATGPAPLLLPPDKVLPPIDTDRVRSSQSHRRMADEMALEPGELASVAKLDLDDSFWWVWITSLAAEETPERKAVFGRCALIETSIQGARWLIIEEKVKGAAPALEEGAYVVEKKSRFGLSKKSRLTRRKSAGKKLQLPVKNEPYQNANAIPASKTSIGPDQHARIQAAAAALQQKHQREQNPEPVNTKRSRLDEGTANKTNSVLSIQPLLSEASTAMKWANKYDKEAIREAYLENNSLGKGVSLEATANGTAKVQPTPNGKAAAPAPSAPVNQPLPKTPQHDEDSPIENFEKPKIVEPVAEPPTAAHPAMGSSSRAAKSPTPPHSPVARKPVHSGSPDAKSPGSPPHQTDLEREANAALLSQSSSSPSKSYEGKKLKKKSGGGGFKKLFGKKKPDRSPEMIAAEQAWDNSLPPDTQASTVKRRLSKLGKKNKGLESEKSSVVGISESEKPATSSISPPAVAAAAAATAMAVPSQARKISPARSAGSDTKLQKQETPTKPEIAAPAPKHIPIRTPSPAAEPIAPQPQKPSTFAQGPLEDPDVLYPAAASSGPPTPIAPQANGSPAKELAKEEPALEGSQPLKKELSPEEKAEIDREATQQQQDRWAQIRKAAAERAAARDAAAAKGSDENSRPSHSARTEDGETSGEETIESRVARIKARVAELTGNIEGQQQPVKPQATRP